MPSTIFLFLIQFGWNVQFTPVPWTPPFQFLSRQKIICSFLEAIWLLLAEKTPEDLRKHWQVSILSFHSILTWYDFSLYVFVYLNKNGTTSEILLPSYHPVLDWFQQCFPLPDSLPKSEPIWVKNVSRNRTKCGKHQGFTSVSCVLQVCFEIIIPFYVWACFVFSP